MKIGDCYICNKRGPVDEHHVVLQAAGGEDGPTVNLCSNCHSLVHKQALNLESKSENVMLFRPDEWERAKPLVNYAILSLRKNKYNPDFNNPYKLQIDLTKRDVYLLHLIKENHGYKSLKTFMRDVVHAYIRSKYPQSEDDRKQTRIS